MMFVTNLKRLIAWLIWAVGLLFGIEVIFIGLELFGDYLFMEIVSAWLMTFSLMTLAFLGMLPLTVIVAYGFGEASIKVETEQRLKALWRLIHTDDLSTRRRVVGRIGVATIVFAMALLLPIMPIEKVISKIETPIYEAILAALLTLVSAVVAWISMPVWSRLFAALLTHVKVPRLFKLFIGVMGGTLLVLGVAVVVTWRDFAVFLPWRPILVFVFLSLLLFGFCVYFMKRQFALTRKQQQVVAGTVAVLFLSGALLAVYLPNSLKRAPYLLEDASGPVSLLYGLVVQLGDRDHDGYLSWLAQGDCAPENKRIHPGALEIIDDGIDQDCDGEDQLKAVVAKPGRHNYSVRPRPKPMPVILITLDAVSAQHMELYGAKRKTMPFLTKKAKEGVVFNHAFSEGPGTRLSFPSIMTGLHNSQIKRALKPGAIVPWVKVKHTLGTVFGSAGYRTVAVAPDNYFGSKIKWLYDGMQYVDRSVAKSRAGVDKNGKKMTRLALKQLDKLKSEKKFLLWVHYTDAHPPHRLPKGVKADFGTEERDIYDREMRLLDEAIEPLFKGIEKRMKNREYIIALTADHGHAFDKKHEKHHQDHDVSTPVTHVPLIFWTSYKKVDRTDQLAQGIDVMPTLMNMVGLKAKDISGDSLLPAIMGKPNSDKVIMQQFYLPERRRKGGNPLVATSVRQGDYVLHTRGGRHPRLYNFKTDPLEEHNLADRYPEITKQLKHLRAAILKWAYPSWNRKKSK